MTEGPLISVIVPIYNVEKYLTECVASITGQTYRNLEIILVDDGSPDNCPAMCDKFSEQDNRIRVIHKPNGGLSDARNAGIDVARGDYLMFVDSDDFIDKGTVAGLLDLATSTDADVACGGICRYQNGNISEAVNRIIVSECMEFTGLEQLCNLLNSKTDCSSCAKLYKKRLLNNLRFIKGRYNEDIIFLFNLYNVCAKVAYTNHRFYYYRITDGSVTSQLSHRTMDALINMHEMEAEAFRQNLPINEAVKNYHCRTCLEIGYIIQREKGMSRFPEQTHYVKKETLRHMGYMLRHPDYNWRDLIHTIIVLIRL